MLSTSKQLKFNSKDNFSNNFHYLEISLSTNSKKFQSLLQLFHITSYIPNNKQ